jgi:hypothetical protein
MNNISNVFLLALFLFASIYTHITNASQLQSNISSWVEGICDKDTSTYHGATRDYYDRKNKLVWNNFMGDWIDADLSNQGSKPFSQLYMPQSTKGKIHTADITDLTNLWLSNSIENQGVFMALDNGEYSSFYSSDNDDINTHPELTITTTQGMYKLHPAADTDLQKTTYTCRGNSKSLVGINNILIRFDLSNINGALIKSELGLYSSKQIYTNSTLNIFAARLPHFEPLPKDEVFQPLLSKIPERTWKEGECNFDSNLHNGATRTYFNRQTLNSWQNYMGDWIDADLISQGPIPFSKLILGAEQLNSTHFIDIKSLVTHWQTGSIVNHGILLKTVGGEYVSFHSKESYLSQYQPRLLINTAEGNFEVLADADTDIQESTFTCRGEKEKLVADNNILLRFDIEHITNVVTDAKLQLTTAKETYSFVELDILAVSVLEEENIIEPLPEDDYVPLDFEVTATSPHIAFTDLISGPSTGLGDSLGSGVIVTAWGFNLGAEQGNSSIEYCNRASCQQVPHIYYWKVANGQLPSGPANLYESHGMQEISFSIPEASLGNGEIKFITEQGTTAISFTVRAGNIYHVMPIGNDSTGDGSFQNPWLTVAKADSTINAGSTLYVHDIITGDENTSQVIYNNRLAAMSSLEAQYSYVSYPNTRPEVIGERGFSVYAGGSNLTAGFVISKFSIYAAEADENENNQPVNVRAHVTFAIDGNKDGRAIANFITDAHPNDVTGACPDGQQAAIKANSLSSDKVSNFKILGNHIKNYGCDGSSRFQHTTYLSIRSGDENEQLVAPEMAWNFLQDNKTSSGLHYFDENTSGEQCGQFIDTVKIHDNVVINQSGPAISYGANCPVSTQFEYYNNIAINVGLKADYSNDVINGTVNSAVSISIGHSDVTSRLIFNNNIFYKWSSDDQQNNLMSCIGLSSKYNNASVLWNSNVCYTDTDLHFIRSNYLGDSIESTFTGRDNAWFANAENVINAITPIWDPNPISVNPLIYINNSVVTLHENSPLISQSNTSQLRGIYGRLRSEQNTVGAVQVIND